ncbi:hypothetical protein [Micromonospora echinofusca]|nr:hypothetical protein [Micromonospora echinofusca]
MRRPRGDVDADGRTMAATWERSSDGATWVDWMYMEFTRTT